MNSACRYRFSVSFLVLVVGVLLGSLATAFWVHCSGVPNLQAPWMQTAPGASEAIEAREVVQREFAAKVHTLLDPEFGTANVAVAVTVRLASVDSAQNLPVGAVVKTSTQRTEDYHGVGSDPFAGVSVSPGTMYSKQDSNQDWDYGSASLSTCELAHVEQVSCSVTIHGDVDASEEAAIEHAVSAAVNANAMRGDQILVRTTRHWTNGLPAQFPLAFGVVALLGFLGVGVAHMAPRARGLRD